MADRLGPLGWMGVQFFGRMSASISHEIKNVLAIINENAGLLEDLALMAGKGVPLDPERLERVARGLLKQVQRADVIVKNMNKFAHSVDDFEKRVDLQDLLSVVVRLALRFADMRRVTLNLQPAAAPVAVTTRPFLLENLLWCCLDFAMDRAGSGGTVAIGMEKTDDGARVTFNGLGGAEAPSFPSQEERLLAEALGARTELDVEGGRLRLILRKANPGGTA